MNKRAFLNIFKYLLALGLLAWVVWNNWDPPPKPVEGETAAQTEQRHGHGLKYVYERHVLEGEPVHYEYFCLAAGFCVASLLLTLCRWYVLVRAVGLPFRILDAIRLGMIGFFFNTFLPGAIGGDVIKAAFLAKEHARRTVAVSTVIMDRAIALWALVWFVAMSGSIFWANGMLHGAAEEKSHRIIEIAISTVVVTLLGWLLLGFLPDHRAERFAGRLGRLRRIGGSAAEFWRAVWMYRCQQKSIVAVMLISWVGHVGFVMTFYFSALTLWDNTSPIPSLAEHFLLVPIGLVIQAMPLFPGGAGIGEWGFGSLYQLFSGTKAYGVLGSLVKRVIEWGIGLVSGMVYLRMKASLPAVEEESRINAELLP